MSQRIASFVLLLCVTLPACSLFGLNGNSNELEENRRLWSEQSVENYQFDLSVGCFCLPELWPATIVVRADTVSAVLDPKTGETKRNPRTDRPILEEYPNEYPTVGGLFEIIERAIDEDADRLKVDYNAEHGYPTRIDVEYSETATDDKVLYKVSNLQIKE